MSRGPVLIPDLASWASQRLDALYKAKTDDEFETAFKHTFNPDTCVVSNGKEMTGEAYKQTLMDRIPRARAEKAAMVQFFNTVKLVDMDGGKGVAGDVDMAGNVGCFLEVIEYNDGLSSTWIISYNMRITSEQRKDIPTDTDYRRIVSMSEVSSVMVNPVN